MPKNDFLKIHLFISFVVLIILSGLLFLTSFFSRDLFTNPQKYFYGLSPTEVQFTVVSLSLILSSILISFVVYLLLASKTRVELKVIKKTSDITLLLDQFIRLYEGAPVPYLMLKSKGKISRPNKAALRFFGIVSEELEGKIFFSLFPKEESDHGDKLLQLYLRDIPINNEEIQMVTKNGEIKWVSLSVFDMRNSIGGGHTGLATIFDITEQKKLTQAKTEFVSLASHQLRTPLVTMKCFMDMLVSGDTGELPSKQKDYINRLYAVNDEMIELVDTLLNVSRIEIGALPIDKSETNIEAISEGILMELSSQIAKKKIRIEKQYNGLLQNTNTDPKLLRIVMQNLISNAIKYTPDLGTVTVTFAESGSKREIIVSDTGYGIPKAEQERIFTKLFRAENARKLSTSQGTGLGLYLVKSIMEALGGGIKFISEENKGSIFTIMLDSK